MVHSDSFGHDLQTLLSVDRREEADWTTSGKAFCCLLDFATRYQGGGMMKIVVVVSEKTGSVIPFLNIPHLPAVCMQL